MRAAAAGPEVAGCSPPAAGANGSGRAETGARPVARRHRAARSLTGAGSILLRYGLVLVLAWIGGMKFTAFEAAAIQPLVASSPFLSWTYGILGVENVSKVFGAVELALATLIALRPWTPRLSAAGSGLAAAMFLTTLSFLVSAPGWEASLGGFPALSGTGGFLVKDVLLLGAAVWTAGEALGAARARGR